jgi:hypothetical protein
LAPVFQPELTGLIVGCQRFIEPVSHLFFINQLPCNRSFDGTNVDNKNKFPNLPDSFCSVPDQKYPKKYDLEASN